MPAFMFEKIPAPAEATMAAIAVKQPRGVIVQMIDRLTANRLQKEARRLRLETGLTEADIIPSRHRR